MTDTRSSLEISKARFRDGAPYFLGGPAVLIVFGILPCLAEYEASRQSKNSVPLTPRHTIKTIQKPGNIKPDGFAVSDQKNKERKSTPFIPALR